MTENHIALQEVRKVILARIGLLHTFLRTAQILSPNGVSDTTVQAMQNEQDFLYLLIELMEHRG